MQPYSAADWAVAVGLLLVALAVVWLLWWLWRRPRPTTYAANPNPARITNEMWWLWQQLQAMEPSSQLGGIYANKAGYHNARGNLPSYDYSVVDNPPDKGGPPDKACAIDWTFPNAQGGNYSTISKYTKRLIDSGKDPDDPRMNGWREAYGQADDDSYVEGWDFRYGYAVTSDSSHLWHIHLSENRDQSTSQKNKEALLSVLRGETVEQWLGGAGGEGAVLTNCPYDKKRQDLFYIAPNGEVWHKWYTGGINTAWSGGGSSENLGGKVASGTLTACWRSDGNSIDIVGLGDQDGKGPAGAGQFWGMNLAKGGARSGWGSFEKCYGAYPGGSTSVTLGADKRDRQAMLMILLALVVIVVGSVVVAVLIH